MIFSRVSAQKGMLFKIICIIGSCCKRLYFNRVQEHHDSFPLSLDDCQGWRVSCPYDQHHVFSRQRKASDIQYPPSLDRAKSASKLFKANMFSIRVMCQKMIINVTNAGCRVRLSLVRAWSTPEKIQGMYNSGPVSPTIMQSDPNHKV